jgi:hypothetical protein
VDEKVKEPQKYNQKEHTLPKVSKQWLRNRGG